MKKTLNALEKYKEEKKSAEYKEKIFKLTLNRVVEAFRRFSVRSWIFFHQNLIKHQVLCFNC